MRPIKEITFSNKPILVGDFLDIAAAGRGDWDAFLRICLDRTDLTQDEIRALTMPEATEIAKRLASALTEAAVVSQIELTTKWDK